eukprot:1791270-Heterocapsa_arctica.AAC.1
MDCAEPKGPRARVHASRLAANQAPVYGQEGRQVGTADETGEERSRAEGGAPGGKEALALRPRSAARGRAPSPTQLRSASKGEKKREGPSCAEVAVRNHAPEVGRPTRLSK